MLRADLPKTTAEVLDVSAQDMPEVIRDLVAARALSRLVQAIHGELHSSDPRLRSRARAALDRLGFAE